MVAKARRRTHHRDQVVYKSIKHYRSGKFIHPQTNVDGLPGVLAEGQPTGPHAVNHENGGSDEINVAGLNGLLADDQNPVNHAVDHERAGTDEIDGDHLDIDFTPTNYTPTTTPPEASNLDHLAAHLAGIDNILPFPISSETIEFDADPATGPSQVFTGDIISFELPNAAEKAVVTDFPLPDNFDTSKNPTVIIGFVPAVVAGANGNVRLKLEARYIAEGELTTKAFDETIFLTQAIIDTPDEIQVHAIFTLDASKMAALDHNSLKITRLGNDALDTYGNSIEVLRHGRFDFNQ